MDNLLVMLTRRKGTKMQDNLITDSIAAVTIGGGVGMLIAATVTGHQTPFILGVLTIIGAVTLKQLARD